MGLFDKGRIDWTGANLDKPPLQVDHETLTRSDDSEYRSFCPVCKVGILPVRRDPETLEVLKEDCCLLCGQRVVYVEGQRLLLGRKILEDDR